MLTLQEYDEIPQGLLELTDTNGLYQYFSRPALLHLEGQHKEPLFISILLHGNEDTGFFAVQELLKRYQHKQLPRSLSIFFGNIEAAKHGLRRLDGQPDYNRVWPGTDFPDCPEKQLMQQVVDIMAQRKPFASIDIHNNTGKNPHYGCINNLKQASVYLASLFSRIVVFFETPKGVQSMAMSQLCPAITIECGKPHQANGVQHATDFVETVLHLETMEPHTNNPPDVEIFHTVARVTIPKSVTFAFENNSPLNSESYDLLFAKDIDKINFTKLPAGTTLAHVFTDGERPITAWDDHEKDVTQDYFSIENNSLKLTKSVMPAMLTLDKKIIRQDCLCYLMEKLAIK